MEKNNFSDLLFYWTTFLEHTNKKLPATLYTASNIITINLDKICKDSNEMVSYDDIYNDINEFFETNLCIVVYNKLVTHDPYRISLFHTNLKRIEKFINRNVLEYDKIHINLLKLYLTLTDEKNLSDDKKQVIDLILKYSDTKKQSYLDEMFNIGIKLNHAGILDKLKSHVDIDIFLNDCGITRRKSIVLKTKGDKITKFLKQVEYKQNI